MSAAGTAELLMVQLAVILAVCWGAGRLVRWIGQPPVVGEMIAGVALGPSLLGQLSPALQGHLFPPGTSMTMLYALSQLGLVLYMFLIGLEFDVGQVVHQRRAAAIVSAAGFLVPMALGALLAVWMLRDQGTFFASRASLWQAALLLGAAIATTAFPMLARIISERGAADSRVGTLALAAGAGTDAVSWILLAAVVAAFHRRPSVVLLAAGGGAVFAVFMLTAGRRALARLLRPRSDGHVPAETLIVVALILVMATAWYTSFVGIHSIFGGFLLGVTMPRGRVSDDLRQLLEPLVKALLLPLFFIYSGLNTQLGLINSAHLWIVALLVMACAFLGKGVACYVASRLAGMAPQQALAVGSLMNSRGLIELILLNIGLDAGVITPTLFTVMVLMAVVTTLTATPIFDLAVRRGALARDHTSISA